MTNDDKNLERPSVASGARPSWARGQRQTPSSHRPELIQSTRELWEPRYRRELSDEEAREILQNMLGFCRVLLAWVGASEKDDLEHAA